MDFTTLTDDDLANAAKAFIDEVEARIAALPDGAEKTRGVRLAALLHGALGELKSWAVGGGHVQNDSGGDPKP